MNIQEKKATWKEYVKSLVSPILSINIAGIIADYSGDRIIIYFPTFGFTVMTSPEKWKIFLQKLSALNYEYPLFPKCGPFIKRPYKPFRSIKAAINKATICTDYDKVLFSFDYDEESFDGMMIDLENVLQSRGTHLYLRDHNKNDTRLIRLENISKMLFKLFLLTKDKLIEFSGEYTDMVVEFGTLRYQERPYYKIFWHRIFRCIEALPEHYKWINELEEYNLLRNKLIKEWDDGIDYENIETLFGKS